MNFWRFPVPPEAVSPDTGPVCRAHPAARIRSAPAILQAITAIPETTETIRLRVEVLQLGPGNREMHPAAVTAPAAEIPEADPSQEETNTPDAAKPAAAGEVQSNAPTIRMF